MQINIIRIRFVLIVFQRQNKHFFANKELQYENPLYRKKSINQIFPRRERALKKTFRNTEQLRGPKRLFIDCQTFHVGASFE